jgi:hypothetical protein
MFVTCYLYGGLGNQLFQLFATIAYSLNHSLPLKIIYTENLGKRPVYWGTFLSGLSSYLSTDIEHDTLYKIKQNTSHILEKPPKNIPVILDGYFQNPKFFENRYSEISAMCGIDVIQKEVQTRLYKNTTISMHFRRGDYKELQHIHPIMPLEYYENALAYITAVLPKDSYKVVYFCEDEDAEAIKTTEIVSLQRTFPNCVFRRFVGSTDWEEMLYMSCCDSHIIANSSFSWWGAYMDRRDSVVCYPGVWFGGREPFPTNMFPESWTKISW